VESQEDKLQAKENKQPTKLCDTERHDNTSLSATNQLHVMKILIDLFRESFAFKLFVGLLAFFLTQQVSLGYETATDEHPSNTIEISFEQKFLEFNDLYLTQYR
jgi:hypothetical protein